MFLFILFEEEEKKIREKDYFKLFYQIRDNAIEFGDGILLRRFILKNLFNWNILLNLFDIFVYYLFQEKSIIKVRCSILLFSYLGISVCSFSLIQITSLYFFVQTIVWKRSVNWLPLKSRTKTINCSRTDQRKFHFRFVWFINIVSSFLF